MKKDKQQDNNKVKDINESKKRKPKLNKKALLFIVIGIILCIGGVLYNNMKPTVSDTPVTFEVLDESVLTRDVFKDWVSSNSSKKGEYTKEDGEFVYAMISYGETTKPGVGICIEEIKGSRNIEIVYSIIESNDERETEKYTPKMILKLLKTNGKITFKQIESE